MPFSVSSKDILRKRLHQGGIVRAADVSTTVAKRQTRTRKDEFRRHLVDMFLHSLRIRAEATTVNLQSIDLCLPP